MPTVNNIITREDLREAVKRDTRDHEIKELTILLIAAMTDWPTRRTDKIEDFVRLFKAFHTVNRRPLDLDRVKRNKFGMPQEYDMWRHEASASVQEMMERSVAVYGVSDLDGIVDRIVNYYKNP